MCCSVLLLQDDSLGIPDGMCVDTEGRLWVAGWLGKHVTCWEPSEGKMVEQVSSISCLVDSGVSLITCSL